MVHMGPFTIALVINGWRVSRVDWIIRLALFSAVLCGVVQIGGSSSRRILLWPTQLELCPGIFSFTSYIVQHLGYWIFFGFPLTCLFWKISRGLRSVLEGSNDFFYIWRFLSELQIFLVNFRALPVQPGM